MPQIVAPSVFHLSTSTLVRPGVKAFLKHIGAEGWTTDTEDNHAELVEIAGRACYRSFGVGLNKNVTRVREGNKNYIRGGILGNKHGSVLEHTVDTFAICDVSRIVTHELVRHRAGPAFSQESGRYVRIDELRYYEPEAFQDHFLRQVWDSIPEDKRKYTDFQAWAVMTRQKFQWAMSESEMAAVGLEEHLGLDHIQNFGLKKSLQSAVRRAIPFGMASLIIITANHRAWRHITSMRTDSAAEEEIRLVQYQIFQELHRLHPNIYQDAALVYNDDFLPRNVPMVEFENEKV